MVKFFFTTTLFIIDFAELLAKKKAPSLALKKKFKKNSDFWVYEKKVRFIIRRTVKKQGGNSIDICDSGWGLGTSLETTSGTPSVLGS